MQAHHLGTGPAVVAQRHRAHRVHARVQHHSGGVHPVRHPEQVDRQAHRVDAQVHERAARHGRVEGRRHRARAVGVHPGGVLLLDQHRTAHRPQPPQVLAHHGHTRFEGRQPALHQQPVGLPSSRHHGTGLRWRHREGLLHEHVPPRPQRRDRVLGMEDVGAAHVDHVHGVLAAGRQHLVQRGVRGGQTVLGGEGCRPLRPRRGHPDDPGVIHHGHRLGEPLRDEPGADDAEPDGGGQGASRSTHGPRLPVRPPVRPSVRLPARPPARPSVRLPARPSVRLPARPSACPPVRLPDRLPVRTRRRGPTPRRRPTC